MSKVDKDFLEQAIANKTLLVTRIGQKAVLMYNIAEAEQLLDARTGTRFPVRGYVWDATRRAMIRGAWTEDGRYSLAHEAHLYDIVGLWKPPRPARVINGVEVPTPLSWDEFVPNDAGFMSVYTIRHDGVVCEVAASCFFQDGFACGHFYATYDDAQSNLEAFVGDTNDDNIS